jgi:glycine betaine/proline transport system permease protein
MTAVTSGQVPPRSPIQPGSAGSPDPSGSRAVPLALRRPGRGRLVVVLLAGWLLLVAICRALWPGRWTLPLAAADLTGLHTWLNEVRDWVDSNRNSNPFFLYLINPIRVFIDHLVTLIQNLLSQPSFGRPVPVIGWLGVVALATLLALAVANVRVALLTCAGLVFLGLQGLWQESMDTLSLTLAAVLLAVLIGVPLGVWAGVNDRVNRTITPVLDFMQTLPSLVYLAPLALFFLIGPASATVTTLIYAAPPVIRYTAYGIREVPSTTVEAATSLGTTGRQRLTGVLLPMSRRAIVLGINQTIMAALAMVTITALIDAPGLGQSVLKALETLDVGTAFNAGLAIVVLAIVLDRLTTAAGERSARRLYHTGRFAQASDRFRRPLLAVTTLVTIFLVYLSRTYLWAAEFPLSVNIGGREVSLGSDIARITSQASTWVQTHLSGLTNGFKDFVTSWVIDPLQSTLTASPWWLIVIVLVGLALLLGDLRAGITTGVCLAVLIGTGVWQDAMVTLAATIVAAVIVVVLGVVVGVTMARRRGVDMAIRPILDAAQVLPAFVYLVPCLALFSASRFTAIVAAVIYAAPVAIKVVADGVRAVPVTAVEAGIASGSSPWQIISKVQLPMAREALVLATNQGLIYVLAMVVVGGLVGAGALGYDVVAGFSQSQIFGKGLAAGVAIVMLGIILNRITESAARRQRTK